MAVVSVIRHFLSCRKTRAIPSPFCGGGPWRWGGYIVTRGAVIAALLTLWAGATNPALAQEAFPKGELAILSGSKIHKFTVEIARTRDQRAQGLMWRRKVPRNTGMLFLYPSDKILQMWMKNTLVPLDMLFIDRSGTIVQIKERTVPHSTAVISSQQKARAVLELAGGTASRLGLKPGDRVLHEALAKRQ